MHLIVATMQLVSIPIPVMIAYVMQDLHMMERGVKVSLQTVLITTSSPDAY